MKVATTLLISVAVALLGLAVAQSASPGYGWSVGLGIGVAPDFVGSDDYQAVPLPSFEYRGRSFAVRSNGLGLEATIIETAGLSVGVIARVDGGRNDLFDAKDEVIKKLKKIGVSAELGLFAEYAAPVFGSDGALIVLRASAVQGTPGGHEGQLFEASAGVVKEFNERWSAGVFATLSGIDANYAQAFYGVDVADSLSSGLPTFAAEGGIRDIGLSAFVTRQLSESLSVTGTAAFTQLQGDAAESPIVRDRGSRSQLFGGLTLTYHFGSSS